jgi:diguanylate cyclase (GGDEF)-like protein
MTGKLAAQIREASFRSRLSNDEERRRIAGRLGGALFCAAAFVSLPSALMLDPQPPSWVFGLIAMASGVGIVSVRIRWQRLPSVALHLLPLSAILMATLGMSGIAGSGRTSFNWLYVMTAIMVAYSFERRVVVAAYLALICASSAAPLLDPAAVADDTLRTLLVSVPSLAVGALAVSHLREQLEAGRSTYEQLSRLDPLTGVGNYRALHDRLDYEIARHGRHGRQFAVMLVDLNRFKEVNDRYGHLAGDRMLCAVAKALAAIVRDEDTVARQGGDEFSILAPETNAVEVMGLAHRLQRALGTIEAGKGVVTASVGWAIFPEDGETAESLLEHADDAMLAGKSRWLPQRPKDYWPEHLRRLRESPGGASGRGEASAAS